MKNIIFLGETRLLSQIDYLITIGCSAGGIDALNKLLSQWPMSLNIAIAIVQHISADAEDLPLILNAHSKWPVHEAADKEMILAKNVYLAPPDYHLLVESSSHFSLSDDEKVCFSRPSIDVLFESAADVFKERQVALLLTGANEDGTAGCRRVKMRGGLTLAQDPKEAIVSTMPETAIRANVIDQVGSLTELLVRITQHCQK